MTSYKTIGRIHSRSGAESGITVLEKCGDNKYIVEYNGVKYHAVFMPQEFPSRRRRNSEFQLKGIRRHQQTRRSRFVHWFVNRFYVDDIYGRIEQ
jgi:hypothetical protein